jgi:hypothetical protein
MCIPVVLALLKANNMDWCGRGDDDRVPRIRAGAAPGRWRLHPLPRPTAQQPIASAGDRTLRRTAVSSKSPAEISPEDIRLRIQSKVKNPNVGHVITSTVKDGPQSYIYATIYEIIDPADRSHHHWCLKLDSCNRSKRLGWTFKQEKSLTIEGAPSLQVLANLVKATITGQLAQKTGDFH